jgi:hypothetical protein
MPLPTIDELKRPTLECLDQGIIDSDLIRDRLARDFGLTRNDRTATLTNRIPTFVNNHAWALVRLQNDGLIRRVARKIYEITEPVRPFCGGGSTGNSRSSRPGQIECRSGHAAGCMSRTAKTVPMGHGSPSLICWSSGGDAVADAP